MEVLSWKIGLWKTYSRAWLRIKVISLNFQNKFKHKCSSYPISYKFVANPKICYIFSTSSTPFKNLVPRSKGLDLISSCTGVSHPGFEILTFSLTSKAWFCNSSLYHLLTKCTWFLQIECLFLCSPPKKTHPILQIGYIASVMETRSLIYWNM